MRILQVIFERLIVHSYSSFDSEFSSFTIARGFSTLIVVVPTGLDPRKAGGRLGVGFILNRPIPEKETIGAETCGFCSMTFG